MITAGIAYLIKFLFALFVLAVLIFVHELGHFLFAKLNKVAVLEFAIGFGKIIWEKKIGTTRYSLRAIPLGGYVRMAGDDYTQHYQDPEHEDAVEEAEDAKDDPLQAVHELDDDEKELLKDRSLWFFEKGLLARSSIVFAGPLFNFIFAWIAVFFVLTLVGYSGPSNKPVIGELIPNYPAQAAGLQSGDQISQVGDTKVETWEALVKNIQSFGPKEIPIIVERGTKQLNLKIVPKPESAEMQLLSGGIDENAPKRYLIGIQPSMDRSKKTKLSFADGVTDSFIFLYNWTDLTVKSLYYLISGQISSKNIGGPITILTEAGNSTTRGLEGMLLFMAYISLSLGILNLLPIPVLDGGHLLMFALEAIMGGRLNKKFLNYANQLGMFLLLALMFFAITNDIQRLF